jgi:hypothetical protein
VVQALIAAAQRLAHQPQRVHRRNGQNANDLVREAVGCMGVFGGARYRLWQWMPQSGSLRGALSTTTHQARARRTS